MNRTFKDIMQRRRPAAEGEPFLFCISLWEWVVIVSPSSREYKSPPMTTGWPRRYNGCADGGRGSALSAAGVNLDNCISVSDVAFSFSYLTYLMSAS